MRRRYRSDDTQDDIVKALRGAFAKVWIIGRPCDLLVRRAGVNYLLDCDGVTKYRKRDADQLKNFADFGVIIVKTPEEALTAVGVA